jgi:hypothetical protein
MSAAVQLPILWGAAASAARNPRLCWRQDKPGVPGETGLKALSRAAGTKNPNHQAPSPCLAFYRKHTEKLLRRYLYASMQVGRAPSILADPVGRGWASSRPVRTFEDAVIFVLDVERCLDRLDGLERELLSRIVLQSYTQAETADLLGMSPRSVYSKFVLALDRLTEQLLGAGILLIPK